MEQTHRSNILNGGSGSLSTCECQMCWLSNILSANWHYGMWVLFRFVFNILQILPIRCTEKILCCIRKSAMRHQQNADLPLFSYMVIGGVCLLSPSLTDRCSQSCLLFNVQWFIKFEDILQSLLTSVFMMFILWSATQWNIGVQLRKVIK
jgi:hypothetical protein